jgi:hypothetical protein
MTDRQRYVSGGTNGRGHIHSDRTCFALQQTNGRIRRARPGEVGELAECNRCNGLPDKTGEDKDMSYQRSLRQAAEGD